MAKEQQASATEQILANIELEFKQIKTDLDNIKTAISESGVPVTNTTRGLANDVKKISTKVEENIKSAEEVTGLVGGAVNISNGFMYPASATALDKSSITAIPGLNKYIVPADKDYLILWPTKDFMKQVAEDKRNIKIEFAKRHFGQLCNTNYRLNKWRGFENDMVDDDTYNLSVNITTDGAKFETAADLTTAEQTMLSLCKLPSDATVLRYKGHGIVSLPERKSTFTINDTALKDAVIDCDKFIVTDHKDVKAVLTDTIIVDSELLYRMRLGAPNGLKTKVELDAVNERGELEEWNVPTVFVPMNATKFTVINTVLDKDNEDVKNNMASIAKYASINSKNGTLFHIAVNDTSVAMNEFLRKESTRLAKLELLVFSYDKTKVYDFARFDWKPVRGCYIHTLFKHWFEYIEPTEEEFEIYTADDDTVINDFKLAAIPNYKGQDIDNMSSEIYLINVEDSDNVFAVDGDVTTDRVHDRKNTIIGMSANGTWKFKRAVVGSEEFPLSMYTSDISNPVQDSDGKNIITFRAISQNMQGLYPFLKLQKNNSYLNFDNIALHVVLLANGYDNGTVKPDGWYPFQLALEMDHRVKFFQDYAKTKEITAFNVEFEETPPGNVIEKFVHYVPYNYNMHVKTVTMKDGVIIPYDLRNKQGKCFTETNGDDAAVPETPMEYIVNGTCRVEEWQWGRYYDRSGKNNVITPAKGEFNAKYIHILIDEDHDMVKSANACRYRLALFTKDKTKRYNYTTKAWEEVGSYTGDTATFAELFPEEFAKLTNVVEL